MSKLIVRFLYFTVNFYPLQKKYCQFLCGGVGNCQEIMNGGDLPWTHCGSS